MHQHAVGTLVVVNKDEEPVGILTDRDLMERVIVSRLDPDETLVGQVMTKGPSTVFEGASLDAALSIMRDGPIRRLPVVDHEGKLVGLLCLDDLLIHYAREFTAIGQILSSETPSGVAAESLADDG
jgi:CBS domain-containing protein